jgi:hypothetical protein
MASRRRFYIIVLSAMVLTISGFATANVWSRDLLASRDAARSAGVQAQTEAVEPAAVQAQDPMIISYAAKFVCMEPIQPGMVWYGTTTPLVKEKTEVLIHNPNDFPVTLYKKAVEASLEDDPPIAPGGWKRLDIGPDHAVKVTCDDIAGLLTGDPAATFLGTYGIGVEVEGFVVVGMGPQADPAGVQRYGRLDVTAEYVRCSEVLKKDISYQPWWWWWWWPLPWRLGYAYERILPIDASVNVDCRGVLYDALHQDVDREMGTTPEAALTHAALDVGQSVGPTTITELTHQSDPALVAMIGGCHKLDPATASVDYVLLSNKGMTDPDPRIPGAEGNQPDQVLYPWFPGHWYDLTVVMPQNISTDINTYFLEWHTQRWIDAGADVAVVQAAMVYYFPYWCGWGHWWYWWNGGDCIDIGVGEGESIDVEQITPVRAFMAQWPPQ